MHVHDHTLSTFAAAIVFGTLLVILSHRLKLSAIVLLLVGGVVLGPHALGLVHPEALGEGLKTIITVAVGLILFEGGLTLDPGLSAITCCFRRIWQPRKGHGNH